MGKLKTTRKRRTYRKINKKKEKKVKKTRNRRKQIKTRRIYKHRRKKKGGFGCYKKCYPFVTDCGLGKKCSMMPNIGVSCPSLIDTGPGWCVTK